MFTTANWLCLMNNWLTPISDFLTSTLFISLQLAGSENITENNDKQLFCLDFHKLLKRKINLKSLNRTTSAALNYKSPAMRLKVKKKHNCQQHKLKFMAHLISYFFKEKCKMIGVSLNITKVSAHTLLNHLRIAVTSVPKKLYLILRLSFGTLHFSTTKMLVTQHLLSSKFGSFRKWQSCRLGRKVYSALPSNWKRDLSNKTKAFKDGSTKVERTVCVYTKKLKPNVIFIQHWNIASITEC